MRHHSLGYKKFQDFPGSVWTLPIALGMWDGGHVHTHMPLYLPYLACVCGLLRTVLYRPAIRAQAREMTSQTLRQT